MAATTQWLAWVSLRRIRYQTARRIAMGIPKFTIDYGTAMLAGMSRLEARVQLAACYRILA
jgi:hypothetical protein